MQNKKLHQALKNWPNWTSRPPLLVAQLGGASNQTYLVRCGKDLLTLRINRTSDDEGVSRSRERAVLNLVAGMDIATTMIYSDDDCLVTDYLPHSTRQPQPAEIGDKLRVLHKRRLDEKYCVQPNEVARNYAAKLNALPLVQPLLRNELPGAGHLTLCHNDLNPGNILATMGGVRFIDWEYAANGPPLFELAVYVATHNLNRRHITPLLQAYDYKGTANDLNPYYRVYHIIEALWWQIRQPTNDLQQRLIIAAERAI